MEGYPERGKALISIFPRGHTLHMYIGSLGKTAKMARVGFSLVVVDNDVLY